MHTRGRARDAIAWLTWVTGLVTLGSRTLASGGRFALLLHGVSSHRLPNVDRQAQPHLTAEELALILGWLKKRFAFLTPEQFLTGDRSGVLLTFDDGFANNFHNARPVLQTFECPALFFISTQHVANPRDWLSFVRLKAEQTWGSMDHVPEAVAHDWYDGLSVEELREFSVDPLVTVGSHGVTHSILTECADVELVRELKESKSFLEDVTGGAIDYFAYPRGQYDARVAGQTEAAGYTAAFAIDSTGMAPQAYELPRVGIYQAGRWYLAPKLSGLHRRPLPVGTDSSDVH